MKGQEWRAIPTQWRKASNILTSTLAAFLFSSQTKRDREAHLNYYASVYKKGRQLSPRKSKIVHVVLKICVRTDIHTQTRSLQYFATAPASEVIITESCNVNVPQTTTTLAAFLFSSHPKRKRDWQDHLNYYASTCSTGRQLSHHKTKLNQTWQKKSTHP